jgi:endonuclease/exonuclease/phosphatase (EEP) superfamily protein YafD
MNKFRLKLLLRIGLVVLRYYCFFRQQKNKERVLAGIFILPALFLLIPTFTFSLTLIQSFVFQIAIVYGILSIYWVIKRHYRVTAVNFVIYLLLLLKVNGPMESTFSIDNGGESLKVLQFNVLANNLNYKSTIDKVNQLSPDFISFQEVSLQWADALEKQLRVNYPFSKVVRQANSHQGIAVFSKHPLIDTQIVLREGTANITGKIKIDNQLVNFLTMHTRSPTSRERWNDRNAHIEWAKSFVNEQGGEFLVLGDFNTVPWDRRLKKFTASTELMDSRKKLTPTYPTFNPFFAQIPIDYIFHSSGISCSSLDSVEITSDHKAILGVFQLGVL